jgi:tol-pal system protein YbgF
VSQVRDVIFGLSHWFVPLGLCTSAFGLALLMAPAISVAQQTPSVQAPSKTGSRTNTPGTRPVEADSRAGESGLRQRVEQLEEQLGDMQVALGTLESLAKGASAPSAPTSRAQALGAGTDVARLDAMETQIGALTAQLEQLADQVRALSRRSGSLDPGPLGTTRDVAAEPRSPRSQGGGFTTEAWTDTRGPVPPATGSSVSTNSGSSDQIGRLSTGPSSPSSGQTAAASISESAAPTAKQLYETAFGQLLQHDYGAAEQSFDEFLKRFPNDGLAGSAQYWQGESYYARGQYRAAANAFLKGYQTYSRSPKAPDSLLKLAMSLERLGQKEAACSSHAEFAAKFPSASAELKARSQAERQRIGC